MKQLPDPTLPWAISMAGVGLLADREDLRLKAYLDWPGRIPTIGWGETANVRLGMVWTKEQADKTLCDEVAHYAHQIQSLCTIPPTENQLAAMLVCAYNIGLPAFSKSTILRQHNAGNFDAAARAFSLFNKARDPNGKVVDVPALAARRLAEAALYSTPDPDAPQQHMPQAVMTESSMAASPINAGGAVAAGGGVLTVLSQYGDQASGVLGTMKNAAETLGVQLPVVLGVVLAIAGGGVIYWRFRQRLAGWV